MKNILFTLLVSTLLFTGCGSTPKPIDPNAKPKWAKGIPPNDGATYGVGMSERHVDGPMGQRMYAVSVALDEIARQKKVKISNTFEKLAQASKKGSSLSTSSYSIQSVEGVEVSARIIDVWEDTKNDYLYILLKSK